MSYAGTLSSNPLIQLKSSPKFRAKKRTTKFSAVSARLDNSKANSTDPQLNLSVLRFTLGNSIYLSLYFSITLWDVYRWWVYWTIGWCRNSWAGRVLLTQMDRIRVWFAFAREPFCWFCFTYASSACKQIKSFSNFLIDSILLGLC